MVFNNSILAGASSRRDFYDYEIQNSLRLNRSDSANLSRTPSSASNRQTHTTSMWVKRLELGVTRLFMATNNSANATYQIIGFNSSDELSVLAATEGSSASVNVKSNAVFRDLSAWYHIVVAQDTTQSTSSNRFKLYVNGTQITDLGNTTYGSQNASYRINNTNVHYINKDGSSLGNNYSSCYVTEVNFIDGQQLDPTSFGETKSGVWIPKEYTGSYGTNGFHLEFADSSNIGDDTSGNTNDWTANNLSAHDVVPDSPTNNYCILNSLTLNAGSSSNGTLSEGNLKWLGTSSNDNVFGTHAVSSEKWYYELRILANANNLVAGWSTTKELGNYTEAALVYFNSAAIRNGTKTVVWDTDVTTGLTFAVNDIIGFALDIDSGNLKIYQNNTLVSTITLPTDKGDEWIPAFGDSSTTDASFIVNFGQDSTFAGAVTSGGNSDANGYGDFQYAVPSGYLALNSANFPETTITPLDDDIPEDYFEANLWTGNGTSQSISSYEFAPDWVWIKERNSTSSHYLVDTIRGTDVFLQSNSTVADTSNTVNVTSFDSNGFSLGTGGTTNENTNTYVGWAWLAGGTAVSNTQGSIASSVSANTKAGFSIVSYTGTGSAATVGHGLSQTPDMMIVKNRDDGTRSWIVYHKDNTSAPETDFLRLDGTNATADSPVWNDTAPTSSVFSVNDPSTNGSGNDIIGYLFHSVEGYSKFGSYIGNGNADGTYVHLGFRPAFVILKASSNTADWLVYDNKRLGYNPDNNDLRPNETDVERTDDKIDLLSNGFKLRSSGGGVNNSGYTFIYMAFAEMPSKYANAR